MHILEILGNCFHGLGSTKSLVLSLFVAGMVGSLSHCVAMCGPFVISQIGSIQKLSDSFLLLYHLGRIFTYTILAALLSSVLNLVFLFLPIRSYIIAPILILAGLIFFINAFPPLAMTLKKIFPWLAFIHPYFPSRVMGALLQKLQISKYLYLKQFLMGLLLGFMPCGLATVALMAASTAPTPLQAGLSMAAFGAGTVPALVATAFAGQTFKSKYPTLMPRVTQAMMVWSGIWLFVMAGIILI